jgi:capsular polysaccharide biosynthesis protein/Mrp family chromosome partitioning ATPase
VRTTPGLRVRKELRMDSSTGAGAPALDAAGLVAAVRHRWWVLVVGAVLGVVAAVAAVQLMPSTYHTTTTVLITPTGAEGAAVTAQSRDKLINLETEAQILVSATVAERVKKTLGSPLTAAELAEHISVEVPPNTTLLAVSATAPTPVDAQKESRAFADEYLKLRAEVAQSAIDAQAKIFQARITETTKRLQAVSGQSVTLPQNSPDRAYAELQQRILVDQITDLSDELSKLQAITVTPGRVLNLAGLPENRQQPGSIVYLAAGLLLGLVLGLAATLLLARLDRHIRWPGDIEALGHVPLLGAIPSAGHQAKKKAMLPAVAPSASPIGQAFGQIRNAITTALPDRPATLLVAGTEPGAGASVVAANLAVALARSGVPVLMVCADLDGSSTERMLGLEGITQVRGLSEALVTDVDPATLLRASPAVRGLWVLGTGIAKSDAADLLQSRQLEWVLSTIQNDSYVVVEAPATSGGAEAQAMARLCDAAVLVVEAGRSRLDALDEGARQISRVGTPLLGAVMVEPQPGPTRRPPKVTSSASSGLTDLTPPSVPPVVPQTPAQRRAASLSADPTVAIRLSDLSWSTTVAEPEDEEEETTVIDVEPVDAPAAELPPATAEPEPATDDEKVGS